MDFTRYVRDLMHNVYRLALIFSMLSIPVVSTAMPALVVDGDADGVSDEHDECPYSVQGSVVAANGCNPASSDSDGDGVEDPQDDCPYSPPGAWIDSSGCALDGDFDGVADGVDLCAHTELKAKVDLRGCSAGQSPAVVPIPAAKTATGSRPTAKIPISEPPSNKTPLKAVPKESQSSPVVKPPAIEPPAPAVATPDSRKLNPVQPATQKPVAPVIAKARDVVVPAESAQKIESKPLKQAETLSDLVEPSVAPERSVPVESKNKSVSIRAPLEAKVEDASDWRQEPLFRTLFFAINSSEITAFSMEKISRALPVLIARKKSHPALRIEVVGYADAAESDQDALSISRERANLVAVYLQAQGIPRSAIHVSGKGVDSARTANGDTSLNRRVEILTYAE